MSNQHRIPRHWYKSLILILVLSTMNGILSAQEPAGTTSDTEPKSELDQQEIITRQFLSSVAVAKNNLGATYYIEGLHDSAAVHLNDALLIAPNFSAAHLTLGLVKYAQGDKAAAIVSFKAAAVDDTVGQRRMGLVHPDTVHTWATAQFNKMKQGTPKLVEAHTALALLYDKGGYKLDAERHYLQAIESDSTYIENYTNLGKLYSDIERYEDAVRLYNKALTFKLELPDQARIYLNIGVAQMESKQFDKAIQAWHQAVDLDPKYAEAYMNIGIAYQTKNMLDSAKVFWSRAIEANGDFIAPRMARARLSVSESQYEDALMDYTSILDKGAKDPRIFAEVGFVYEQKEEYDRAIANYEEALKLSPNDSEIRSIIEIVKQKQQDIAEARQANKIRVRQIVVRQKAEAEKLLIELREGADFIALARLKSIDSSSANGGDLGFFGSGEMIPAFEKAAMSLKVGEISAVTETPMGFHIIKRIE